MKAEQIFNDLKELFGNVNKLHNIYTTKQSEIDKEITDIHHAIELNNNDAIKMMKLYKMLKDRLVARRIIKNELAVIHSLKSLKGNCQKNFNNTEKLIKVVNGQRSYTPRSLNRLFEK